MYKRIPLQIAFVAFPNPDTAAFTAGDLALTLLERDISCSNILIITKNTNSQVDISEFGKNGPLKGLIAGSYGGTIVGASIGGIALSLLGPFGIAIGGGLGALAGATVGAVGGTIGGTAKALMARSVDKKRIQSFASCLEPESSALVAIFGEV
ncbi:unknown protein [Seminavis robusta]|uniref:DUF1269 domain-containing protein n=1 Tax=Seminavis robusta TaxID=568900 RepID=A0A9N8ECP5_9STRA|nr:unknown protein [Seminavis robusta]|eukprot:Sro931_g221420.1 n/a (153) ;mRNA; f:5629-6087